MTAQAGVYTFTVALAELKTLGLSDGIYYGYRAWGPNWPFDPAWAPPAPPPDS